MPKTLVLDGQRVSDIDALEWTWLDNLAKGYQLYADCEFKDNESGKIVFTGKKGEWLISLNGWYVVIPFETKEWYFG